jgi:hypothetical protein
MARELSRQEIEELYLPPAGDFVHVDVPELRLFMLDGEGAEGSEPIEVATQWLLMAIHPIRMEAEKQNASELHRATARRALVGR